MAHCFIPQLERDHTIYCTKCAVFQLASAAVNQNQARFKYRFYLQFPTSAFHVFCSFNNIIFQNSWGSLEPNTGDISLKLYIYTISKQFYIFITQPNLILDFATYLEV